MMRWISLRKPLLPAWRRCAGQFLSRRVTSAVEFERVGHDCHRVSRFPGVHLQTCGVMSNHFHALVYIGRPARLDDAGYRQPRVFHEGLFPSADGERIDRPQRSGASEFAAAKVYPGRRGAGLDQKGGAVVNGVCWQFTDLAIKSDPSRFRVRSLARRTSLMMASKPLGLRFVPRHSPTCRITLS